MRRGQKRGLECLRLKICTIPDRSLSLLCEGCTKHGTPVHVVDRGGHDSCAMRVSPYCWEVGLACSQPRESPLVQGRVSGRG
jgi:hypothetical protein